MKKLLLGLFMLGSWMALGNSISQTARLLNARCNTKHGIGEAEFAVYDKEKKSFTLTKLNVVNDSLCGKGNSRQSSKLVEMAFSSIIGGESVNLHELKINSFSIVTDIQELNADTGSMKKLYKKFNLLKLGTYEQLDLRIVDLELAGFDQTTIDRIPELIEMAKMD
jgi:hypothetical protein